MGNSQTGVNSRPLTVDEVIYNLNTFTDEKNATKWILEHRSQLQNLLPEGRARLIDHLEKQKKQFEINIEDIVNINARRKFYTEQAKTNPITQHNIHMWGPDHPFAQIDQEMIDLQVWQELKTLQAANRVHAEQLQQEINALKSGSWETLKQYYYRVKPVVDSGAKPPPNVIWMKNVPYWQSTVQADGTIITGFPREFLEWRQRQFHYINN